MDIHRRLIIFILFVFLSNNIHPDHIKSVNVIEQRLFISSSAALIKATSIHFGMIDPLEFCPENGFISQSSVLIVKAPNGNGWFVRFTDWEGETLPFDNWKLKNTKNPDDFLYFNIRADQDAYGRITSLNMIDGKTDHDPQGTIIQEQTIVMDTKINTFNDSVRELLYYGYILPNQIHKAKDGYYYKVLSVELWSY